MSALGDGDVRIAFLEESYGKTFRSRDGEGDDKTGSDIEGVRGEADVGGGGAGFGDQRAAYEADKREL